MPHANNGAAHQTFLSVQYFCFGFHSPSGMPSVWFCSLHFLHLQFFFFFCSTCFSYIFLLQSLGNKIFSQENCFPHEKLTKTNICNQFIEGNIERHLLRGLIVWPGTLDGWIIVTGSQPWFISSSLVFLPVVSLKYCRF